jgi:hypothetical protein
MVLAVNLDLYRKDFVIVVVALSALALYWMLAPFWGALAWGILCTVPDYAHQ